MSHVFRAYHAMGYLSTSKGVPSHAVLILSTMLWKLIREEQPDYLAIAWDPPGPTFRDALSAEYKATRSAMPDDLVRQLPYVRRLFEALRTRQVPVALDLDAFRRVEPDWGKLRVLWMEMEFSRLVKELPPPPPPAAPEPSQLLEGPAAIAAWLDGVPAGAPLALDWAGESPPPEPRITGLAVFHPAAGAAEIGAGEAPASLGARELIVHDAKPLIESWLARGVAPPPVHDSAVAAYLLNSARQSYRLEQVCMDAFGDCPPAADPARALGVRATSVWRYWEHAAAELRARELWTIYEEIERPLVLVLALMERHGIRVDPGRLEAFAKELERDLDNLTREIYQLAGAEFTIASPKQLAQILFEKLKLPPIRRTKTGYSTDADVLTELAVGHPLPAKILEHRSLAKLKGTYADTLPGLINQRTGRIHTTLFR